MTNRESAAKMRAGGASLREIAEALGMSREGARQLLLPLPQRHCPSCGKPVAGRGRVPYCRAPCLPPSEKKGPAAPLRRKREQMVGPPRRRGRPRKVVSGAEVPVKKKPKKKGGGK